MKIKLLACFAFVVILSSCTKEEEIAPKQSDQLSSNPIKSTSFNNSWPLVKTVKPTKLPETKPTESFNNSWPLAKFYF